MIKPFTFRSGINSILLLLIFAVSNPVFAQKTKSAVRDLNRIEARGIVQGLSDDELLEEVQRQTFRYFWDFAHPVSGLARDRSKEAYGYGNEVVTTGVTGFGIMSTIVSV